MRRPLGHFVPLRTEPAEPSAAATATAASAAASAAAAAVVIGADDLRRWREHLEVGQSFGERINQSSVVLYRQRKKADERKREKEKEKGNER